MPGLYAVREFDVYITPDGVEYPLVDGRGRSLVVGISGLGMPPLDWITQSGPFQDGSSIVDFRVIDRRVQFVLRVAGRDRGDYWRIREELLDVLRPNRQTTPGVVRPGVLRKVRWDGSKRDLYVVIEQGPGFVGMDQHGVWDEYAIQEPIAMVAHDPIFFDPNLDQIEVGNIVSDGDLLLPFEFPFFLGIVGIYEGTANIVYTGTYHVYPTIRYYGPLQEPELTNVTTGETIHMLCDIPAGDVVTIDLSASVKTVTNSAGDNLYGTITPDSDFATFHIAPHPEAPDGVNVLSLAAFGAAADSRAVVEYHTRYIGI